MRSPLLIFQCFLLIIFSVSFSFQANAALFHDIGYEALEAELGALTPDGSGVAVSLVEAGTGGGQLNYLPDTSIKAYTNRSSGTYPTNLSGHASGSARSFYGNDQHTAPNPHEHWSTSQGISTIDVYEANHWLEGGYLNSSTVTGTGVSTVITSSTIAPETSSTRVSSHSYAGNAGIADVVDTLDLELLQRMDFLADKDDHILAVAMNNGSSNQPLNGSSYNAIVVGRTDANHPVGTVDVNPTAGGSGLYNATNRSGVDIVVPESTTSGATPRVASAAALLVGYGHDKGVAGGIDDISNGSVTNRNSDIIYHAETSEVIKATLMAGASRSTSNTTAVGDITDYRADVSNQTTNGLDKRFGAGQLNIQNSYHILAAGEQDAGSVVATGFDYDDSFGGLGGSASTAFYEFTNGDDDAWFAASLAWNISFDDLAADETFQASVAHLFDLNLSLSIFNGSSFDVLTFSNSTIDNTENIWWQIDSGLYRLEVTSVGDFDHDYGIAWQTSPVPVPAAVWLLISAISGLGLIRRKNKIVT